MHPISISSDSRWITFSPNGRKVCIWDTHHFVRHVTLTHCNDFVSADFSPAGGSMTTGSLDGEIRIWSYKSYREEAGLRAGNLSAPKRNKRIWS